MALTKSVSWKGVQWDNAYLKISKVEVSDYFVSSGDIENPILTKRYQVEINVKIYTDNTKEYTIDMLVPWYEYNSNNTGKESVVVMDLSLEDLNYATYYEKLKLIPQLSDWENC